MFYHNAWGKVYRGGGSWGVREAMVLCRQLGWDTGSVWSGPVDTTFGYGGEPVYNARLQCVGDEARLVDCLPRDQNVDVMENPLQYRNSVLAVQCRNGASVHACVRS